MRVALLILHALCAVALLGALTHQWLALLRGNNQAAAGKPLARGSFWARYTAVGQGGFTIAIVVLFAITLTLGAVVYPAYRLDVRIPFEEMGLGWAVGLFEIKEHWAGIGLGILPLYAYVWRPAQMLAHSRDRIAVTSMLALIVWFDFIIGHVLNNIRGL